MRYEECEAKSVNLLISTPTSIKLTIQCIKTQIQNVEFRQKCRDEPREIRNVRKCFDTKQREKKSKRQSFWSN